MDISPPNILTSGAKSALSKALEVSLQPPPYMPLYQNLRDSAPETRREPVEGSVLFYTPGDKIGKLLSLYTGESPVLVVDAACGRGLSALEIRRRFPNAVMLLVDLMPEALNVAKAALQDKQNVKYFEGKVEQLTLAVPRIYHGSVDLVFMCSIVDVIDEKLWESMFFRAGKVLKGGGNLLFDVPFASYQLSSLEFMVAKAVAEVFHDDYKVPLPPIPINGTAENRIRPPGSIEALLGKTGFRDVFKTDEVEFISPEETFSYTTRFFAKMLFFAEVRITSPASKVGGFSSYDTPRDLASIRNFADFGGGAISKAFERISSEHMYSESSSRTMFRAIK